MILFHLFISVQDKIQAQTQAPAPANYGTRFIIFLWEYWKLLRKSFSFSTPRVDLTFSGKVSFKQLEPVPIIINTIYRLILK